MPSILIIDDHVLVRQGLRRMLSGEYRDVIFGEAQNSDEATAQLAKHRWDLVVLDITIPGKNGFYVLQEIRQRHPSTSVLVLSMHADSVCAVRAHEMGASGYVCKSAGSADILKAFKKVLAGKQDFGQFLPPENAEAASPSHTDLSAREHRVMLALSEGKRAGEIAAELNLSIKTISTYKRRILDKLKLQSTADLVRYVIDHGLS